MVSKLNDTGERLIPEKHHRSLAYGEHMSRYRSVMNIVKNKVVLDIASGTGYGTYMMAQDAKKVIGVDISQDAIDYSIEHYSSKNIEYKCGGAYKIPVQDNSIDIVVSLETIEHLDKPEIFVKEVKRVLRKDGLFVVSTPNDDQFVEGNEFHVHQFQLPELKKLTVKYFKNIKYYYQLSYYATALMDEKNLVSDKAKINQVTKSFTQNKKDSIYYVAVCSDEDISDVNLLNNCYLPDSFSEKSGLELSKNIEDRISQLDRTILQQNSAIKDLSKEKEKLLKIIEEKEKLLNDILGSRRYKIANSIANIKNKL